MGRLVSAGAIVYDQLDFYNPPGGIVRATGITLANLAPKLFYNNVPQAWPFQDGTLVPDSSVASGTVYFYELAAPWLTYYSVRFFPDRVGYWRLIFTNVGLGVELIRDYDVVPAGALASSGPSGGLNASFVKQ
jgi:hypothetical protein